MPTVDVDAGGRCESSQDFPRIERRHLAFERPRPSRVEVGSIAKFNNVFVGLRQVHIRTLADFGVDFFDESNFTG